MKSSPSFTVLLLATLGFSQSHASVLGIRDTDLDLHQRLHARARASVTAPSSCVPTVTVIVTAGKVAKTSPLAATNRATHKSSTVGSKSGGKSGKKSRTATVKASSTAAGTSTTAAGVVTAAVQSSSSSATGSSSVTATSKSKGRGGRKSKTSTASQSTTTTSGNSQSASTGTASASTATNGLDPNAANCVVKLPANLLSAAGLSTPWILQPPCSQSVTTQQSFAEAAIFDPATNTVSIYHPLIADAAAGVAAAPVVPKIPAGATVGVWFGFNGGVLTLADSNGLDTNSSPDLKNANCINGLSGVKGDVFGQVSWCNAEQFFTAVNNKGGLAISSLGTDHNGDACPTSRSFTITDACPSDNVPTQYLLLADGKIAQDTAANRAANSGATVINNASDEALVANILDPVLGCTPFTASSLDDPGAKVPALALAELQAAAQQAAPIGLVPLNDPDTLLTSNGAVSTSKTNEYRLGVNQPIVAAGADAGDLVTYCNDMISVAPPFLQKNQGLFSGQTTPDAGVGNNLFTFLCNRFITSLSQLKCPNTVDPVACTLDGNGAATNCTITISGSGTATGTSTTVSSTKAAKATKTAAKATKATGRHGKARHRLHRA